VGKRLGLIVLTCRVSGPGEVQGHLAVIPKASERRILPAWRVGHLVHHTSVVSLVCLLEACCGPRAATRVLVSRRIRGMRTTPRKREQPLRPQSPELKRRTAHLGPRA
jgi:hypothetical protein